MSGQEIGREERERRHVAERMVVLERVHLSEIGCNVSHSVKLDAGVKLQVENCHRFGKRLVKFGFDVDVEVVGKTGVPTLGTAVQCKIKDENGRSFHELGGRDQDARLSLVYPETAEERQIIHRTSLSTGRV